MKHDAHTTSAPGSKPHTALRLKLLANGYCPLPEDDKASPVRRWNTVHVDKAQILKWDRSARLKGTALRLQGGLAVVDLDIDHLEVMELIAARIRHYLLAINAVTEEQFERVLMRTGSGAKEAWFFRTDAPFVRYASRGWKKHPDDARTHRAEVFGGAGDRYFGAFGAHSRDEHGNTRVEYGWLGPTPEDVRLKQLPVLSVPHFAGICDLVDGVMRKIEWHQDVRAKYGRTGGQTLFDIPAEATFDLLDGRTLSVAELVAMADADHKLDERCSASFIEGAAAKNRTRCRIHSRQGRLIVYDHDDCNTHRLRSDDPKVAFPTFMERLQRLRDANRRA